MYTYCAFGCSSADANRAGGVKSNLFSTANFDIESGGRESVFF